MKIRTYKAVDYAYPTSTTATRNGYGKTGCYAVKLVHVHPDGNWTYTHVKAFAKADAAYNHAAARPENWHPLWMKYDEGHIARAENRQPIEA